MIGPEKVVIIAQCLVHPDFTHQCENSYFSNRTVVWAHNILRLDPQSRMHSVWAEAGITTPSLYSFIWYHIMVFASYQIMSFCIVLVVSYCMVLDHSKHRGFAPTEGERPRPLEASTVLHHGVQPWSAGRYHGRTANSQKFIRNSMSTVDDFTFWG